MTRLDELDLKILSALQEDGRLTNKNLAKKVGLSPSPCWRRVRRLEQEGVIRGYQAVLGQRTLGLGITAIAAVETDRQDSGALHDLEEALQQFPEVVACYIVAGANDFLVHVVAADLDEYAHFALEVLGRLPGVRQIQSSIVLKEVKPFVRFPVRLPPEAAEAGTARPKRGAGPRRAASRR